jgi:hypothetical protein
MFTAEFAAVLAQERNKAVRDRVDEAAEFLAKGRAGLAEAFAHIRDAVDYQDMRTIGEIFRDAFFSHGKKAAATARHIVERSVFGFDARTLQTLAAAPRDETERTVAALMAPHVVDAPLRTPGNTYAACGGSVSECLRTHCDGRLLPIPAPLVKKFVQLLAADIHNPHRRQALTNTAGVIDAAAFAAHPDEELSVSNR